MHAVSIIFGVALSLALVAPALAANGGEGGHTNCNGQGNPNSPCVNTGGAGGGGGAGGTATATATSTNVNVNTQGQQQGQYQGQGQSYEGQQHTSVNVDGTRFDRYAPPVAAPALTSAGTGVCLGSVSIGLSGPMAGASFGITKIDRGCEQRSAAALLYQMGYKDAAVRLLMKNDDVRDAMAEPVKKVDISIPSLTLGGINPLRAFSGQVSGASVTGQLADTRIQDESKPTTWVLAPSIVQGN